MAQGEYLRLYADVEGWGDEEDDDSCDYDTREEMEN